MKMKKNTRQKAIEHDDEDDGSVDYAAAADLHANASDSEEENNAEDESHTTSSSNEEEQEGVVEYNVGDHDEEDVNEEESSEEESEDDNDDEEEEEEIVVEPPKQNSVGDGNRNPCNFDLRNLLATSTHPIDQNELYNKQKHQANKSSISFINEEFVPANEEKLLQQAEQSCQQLIAALWQLPRIRSSGSTAGPPMVLLPSFDNSNIPRALPLPPPKAESKWEKFAREKGIAPKTKRSRKVWDETTQQWLYRTGYQKANNDKDKEWPIMEVAEGQDPYQDPWQTQRDAKRARVDENVSKRLKNQEQAGLLAKGTANKLLKAKNKARELGKVGDKSNDSLLPVGVPVDLGHAKKERKTLASSKLRGNESTMKALVATQRSTASLGKFDKPREGEPERRELGNRKKKRQLVSAQDKVSETERNAKLLASIGENAVAKEKARKKGKLANGETAYDYEFSDGLGASTFRKKKGRAGAGKMKKMTKKRVK